MMCVSNIYAEILLSIEGHIHSGLHRWMNIIIEGITMQLQCSCTELCLAGFVDSHLSGNCSQIFPVAFGQHN